jgi:uncharacterized protein (TIGR03083 family)
MSTDVRPSPSMISHSDWMQLATREYARLDDLLRSLGPADWRRDTDCEGWDVHAVVSHLAGAARATASPREAARQARSGREMLPDGVVVDRMNAVQVHDRTEASPQQLVEELQAAGAHGVRARRRLPRPLRALPVPFGPPLGTRPLGYLMDRIYTRDAWMHRIDLARATGRPLALTADHDGRVVADVVQEWATAHGRPFVLTLTGPAGGHWRCGSDGESLELDAVELCRVLSGRRAQLPVPTSDLLSCTVPF